MTIKIVYAKIGSTAPVAYRTFTGPIADVLAANFQSAHPELHDIDFKVIR